ncbi:RidA family protein [Paucibacter sp. M5-1]|uniref:RidA family protein n=1 Tax=Paucibacter sp. M5-1 TaxID=3015998 RepID=UPI0022B934CD|nr:RidA family protein [Paucibacter sp. M5-1]MCZ7880469.1 RidA family protein [Paucibacter sp. M5-1]
MLIKSIQPANLWDSSPYLFSQVVRVDLPRSLVFISGQVALAPDGSLVGAGDVDAQLKQVFSNLRAAVEGAGGTLDNIASLTVYLKEVAHHHNYLKVLAVEFAGRRPAETLVQVAALGLPELLVEIQAVAVL